MLTARTAISTVLDPGRAAEEACVGLLGGGDGSALDAVLVLVTAAHGAGIGVVAERVASMLAPAVCIGASVRGVLAPGLDVLDNPAMALLGFSGVQAEGILLESMAGHETRAGEEIASHLHPELEDGDLVVVLADAEGLRIAPVVEGLARDCSAACVAGVAAAGASGGAPPLVWRGGHTARAAVAALVLRRAGSVKGVVASSCRQATEWLDVTRARGSWLRGLGGRPALDVYREALHGPLADDLRLASRHLLVGLRGDASRRPGHLGPMRVCAVVGFDEARGAIALPVEVPSGEQVALMVRDPATARTELDRAARHVAKDPVAAGLVFNCVTRGSALFEHPGLELGCVERAWGDVPFVGAYGGFQIGPPAGDEPGLLTHSAVLVALQG